MSKEFKVGDRVRVAKQSTSVLDKDAVVGDVGTVKVIGFMGAILAEFDQARDQYRSGRTRGLKNGYWCEPETLEHINTDTTTAAEKIIITTDGKTTTARRYKGKELLGSAEAVCSASDPFNFERGAIIAFARLTDCDYKLADAVEAKPEPKFKVGDVVRVRSSRTIDHTLVINSLAVVHECGRAQSVDGFRYLCYGSNSVSDAGQYVHENDLEKYEMPKGE